MVKELVQDARAMQAEQGRRVLEGLRLYRPMPIQKKFHESLASERIIRGGVRAGKSVAGFAEDASAAIKIPIRSKDGSFIKNKYSINRPLTIWLIGYDQRHIGRVIFKNLFEPGAFRTIVDEKTKKVRAWNPEQEYDREYEEKTKESPPLIPSRFYNRNSFSWEHKGDHVFTVCRLTNGTELYAFSSKAPAAQGVKVDLIHIDEDIEYPGHMTEWQSRLADLKGRLIWTAFPHSANEALINLSDRARELEQVDNPDVEEFILRFSDNPYIDKAEKRKMIERWSRAGIAEVRARDLGDFVTDMVRIYPDFSPDLHGISIVDKPNKKEDPLAYALYENHGKPPKSWMKVLALDPGHAKCGVMFAAIPPPEEFGDYFVVYDELLIERQNADGVAKKVAEKAGGQHFSEFVIDYHAGRRTPEGFSHTVMEQYVKAFRRYEIISEHTGSGFSYGSDNVQGRIEIVRGMMTIRKDGTTKLKIVLEATLKTQREFLLYKKRIVHREVQDEPIKRNDDLMDCLAYLAAKMFQYEIPVPARRVSPAIRQMKSIDRIFGKKDAGGKHIYMGPGVMNNQV